MNFFTMVRPLGLALMLTAAEGFSQEPRLPRYSGETHWDKSTGTFSFISNGSMPEEKEAFFWQVPPEIRHIVINPGVTVKGGFRVTYRKENNPLWIEGGDRKSSVIFGTDEQRWTANRNRSGVGYRESWPFRFSYTLA